LDEHVGVPGGYQQAGVNPAVGDYRQMGLPSLNALGGGTGRLEEEARRAEQIEGAKNILRRSGPTAAASREEAVEQMKGLPLSPVVQEKLNALGLGHLTAADLARPQGPGGPLTFDQYTQLNKASIEDGMTFARAGHPDARVTDIAPWDARGAGTAGPGRSAYAMLPEATRTDMASRAKAKGDAFQLPLADRRALVRMKRGGLSPRAVDIAMGRRPTPQEFAAEQQRLSYGDMGMGEAIAGLGPGATPGSIGAVGDLYGRGLPQQRQPGGPHTEGDAEAPLSGLTPEQSAAVQKYAEAGDVEAIERYLRFQNVPEEQINKILQIASGQPGAGVGNPRDWNMWTGRLPRFGRGG
jgi:hypothetical protein